MSLFNWGEKYHTGVNSIDLQHKKLFDLINNLHEAIVDKKNEPLALKETLDNLILYIQNHFIYEENLLSENNFPGAERHFLEHEKLCNELEQFIRKFQKGELKDTMELLNFTIEWLQYHILESDKKCGRFLSDRGVK